jgi:hypothetical protein
MTKRFKGLKLWSRNWRRIIETELGRLVKLGPKSESQRHWEYKIENERPQSILLANEMMIRQVSLWGVYPW